MMATRGLPLGIDFSGGTLVVRQFEQGVTEADVRSALDAIPGDKVVQQYDDAVERPDHGPAAAGRGRRAHAWSGQAQQVEQALRDGGPEDHDRRAGARRPGDRRGPAAAGIYATLASILAITIYIAFRFRLSFAVGAIAATLHDVLVTLAFLSFFSYDLSLNVVAAILTITGYSVNDTIVIFDRVRENLRSMRREPLEEIVNISVNQTLSRTIITAGTTFLSVLSLYLFGGEVLRGFAFTMLVGIISGTYSTVFIASAIAIILSQRSAAAAAPAGGRQPTSSGAGSKGAQAAVVRARP